MFKVWNQLRGSQPQPGCSGDKWRLGPITAFLGHGDCTGMAGAHPVNLFNPSFTIILFFQFQWRNSKLGNYFFGFRPPHLLP